MALLCIGLMLSVDVSILAKLGSGTVEITWAKVYSFPPAVTIRGDTSLSS